MELVGYIAECHDHEYIVVTQIKPTEQPDKEKGVKNYTSVKLYTTSKDVYSTAVECHSKGVPAVFYVNPANDETLPVFATGIDPIDLTEDDVKERLRFLTNAINCLDRSMLGEYVEKIVEGLLTAFTNYRQFKESYEDSISAINSVNFHAEQLKEILDKETKE